MKTIDLRHRSEYTIEDLCALEALIHKKFRTTTDVFDLNWRMAQTLFALRETANLEEDQVRFFNQYAKRAERSIETLHQRAKGYNYIALCRGRRGQVGDI